MQFYNKNYDGCADAYKVTAKKHFSFQPARELRECQWRRLNFWRQTVPRWRSWGSQGRNRIWSTLALKSDM